MGIVDYPGQLTAGPPGRRLLATALDLPIVAGCAVAAGVVGLGLRSIGLRLETPVALDVLAFATLVAPVAVTLALLEAGPRSATPGKRRLGLRVVDDTGLGISRRRALVRAAVKLAPWQLAHTAVFHLAGGDTSPGWVAVSLTAQALVLASVAVMALDPRHRAPHDLVAGTRVVARPAPADPPTEVLR